MCQLKNLYNKEVTDPKCCLDHESKHELAEILRQWLVEERRSEILQNARQAKEELRHGQTKSGSLDDMMKDIYAED